MISRPTNCWLGQVALLLLLCSGCGGPQAGRIAGNVSLDGQPVPLGTIAFHSDSGRTVSGSIRDGKYMVDKAPIGPAKISVQAHPPSPQMRPPNGEATTATPPQVPTGKFRPLPPRYLDKATSGLAYTVQPGEQTHDVTLSGK